LQRCHAADCIPGRSGRVGAGGAIVTYEDNPPTLRCYGNEDRSTQSLRRQALSKALCAPADVLVDLSELAFADPSLMLDLVMIARRLRKAGRELTLRGAQPDIAVLIEYVGVHRLPGVNLAPAPAPA
jgi:anti-anti-sigma regulatory factor